MGKVTPLKIDVNDGRLPLKDKGLDMKDFSSVAELRRDQLEKLAAGFRMFAHFGFNSSNDFLLIGLLINDPSVLIFNN